MGKDTPTWGSGTTVLRSEEYQKKIGLSGIDNRNRTKALQNMIRKMKASSEPYHIDGTFYPETGGQFALVEAGHLSNIEFNNSLSRAFVICDGVCYEYNEYMKFDVKEKLQKTSGGTVTDIQMVDADGNTGVGYHKEAYKGSVTVDNAATIRLRVTLDTSSSAKQWVTFYNKWEEGLAQMTIEKTIDEADTEDNTFLFEVSGEDGSKFYTSVVIPAGETKGSQILESIPAGTWEVKELDHMRYELAGDYIYSTEIFKTGDFVTHGESVGEAVPFFTEVEFFGGNELVDLQDISITVNADAIQADNLPDVDGDGKITEVDIEDAFGEGEVDSYDDNKTVFEQ